MVDATTAILLPEESGQMWEVPENAEPETVARFDRAYSLEGDFISPIEGDLAVEPKGIGDSILQQLMKIDSNYQQFFSEGMDGLPWSKLGIDEPAPTDKTANAPGADLLAMLKSMEDSHVWGVKMMFWLSNARFTSDFASAMSGVTKTMLRSGGG